MKLKFASLILTLSLFNTELKSQWILLQNFGAGRISDIEVHNNFLFAASEAIGVSRSSDDGVNWVAVNSGMNTTYVTCLAANSFGIFASTGSGVFSSSNNGNNWNITGSGISGGYIRKVTSVNNDIYAGHGLAGVFKTTNNGVSWQRFALGEGDKMFAIYGTQSEFYISVANTILRTTDNGLTFNTAVNGLTNLSVMTLSSFQSDLYAGSRGGIFHSTDIGNIWTRVTAGLTDSVFNVIINKGINVFASSRNRGMFLSTNRGQSWTSINTGLNDSDITSLAASDEYLFAGSSDGNIWRRPLTDFPVDIRQAEINLADDFTLQGNFPNPFNPSTKIIFSINKNVLRTAELKIYDTSGELVEAKKININSSGSYETIWNAEHFSSGVYFCSINYGGKILSSKMLLMK